MDTLTRLEDTIAQRRRAAPETSYVASLSARGLPVIARKFGEEAVEAVVAALAQDREEPAYAGGDWTIWTANTAYSLPDLDEPVGWLVMRGETGG